MPGKLTVVVVDVHRVPVLLLSRALYILQIEGESASDACGSG